MTGHRPFNELRKAMTPARSAENAAATQRMLHDMALAELRVAREKTQADMARTLHVGQPAIARLENRADMYVSNLRRYIEALGGKLEITARFPDAVVVVKGFGRVGE